MLIKESIISVLLIKVKYTSNIDRDAILERICNNMIHYDDNVVMTRSRSVVEGNSRPIFYVPHCLSSNSDVTYLHPLYHYQTIIINPFMHIELYLSVLTSPLLIQCFLYQFDSTVTIACLL